jgi:hypothetical protein
MFEMHPGTLEEGMARRHEMVRASMGVHHADGGSRKRVAGTVRFRHAVATFAAAMLG